MEAISCCCCSVAQLCLILFYPMDCSNTYVPNKNLGISYTNNWATQVVLVVKNLPANAGDIRTKGSTPGLRRSPGGGHGNPLQYSCLENPMDGGAWQPTVCGLKKSRTWLKWLSRHAFTLIITIFTMSRTLLNIFLVACVIPSIALLRGCYYPHFINEELQVQRCCFA